MYTIISPTPDNLITAIKPYREKYDSQAGLIPPHITIVEPFQFTAAPDKLYAHLSDISDNYAPIKVFLVGWHTYKGKDYQIHLPMTVGQTELAALRQDILTGLMGSLAPTCCVYHPCVMLGRFTTTTEFEVAKQTLKEFEPRFNFRIGHMELWQRDEANQPWRLDMKFGLKATVISQTRRQKLQ